MKNIILIFATMFLLASCNSGQGVEDLTLNNGEKWQVNAEMTPHIEQGNEILNDYLLQDNNNFQELATALKTQNNSLIKSCTMKGESHDELHKWLHPHMKLIEGLSKTSDPEEAKSIIKQIENSFNIYNDYFE